MNEKDYLRVSNLQSVTNALAIIRQGVLKGDDYGISEQEYMIIHSTLVEIQTRLFRLTCRVQADD